MAKPKTAWQLAVTDAVTVLADTFGRKVNEVTFRAYELGLDGIQVEQLKIAIQQALQTCRFMPSPAELRELSGESLKLEDRAAAAWLAFNEACRPPLWLYRSVDFDCPVINATLRALGGWAAVSRLKNHHCGGGEYTQFFKPQFEKTYAALCRSGISAEQGRHLPGEYVTSELPYFGLTDEQTAVVPIATGLPPLLGVAAAPALPPADLPRLEIKRP